MEDRQCCPSGKAGSPVLHRSLGDGQSCPSGQAGSPVLHPASLQSPPAAPRSPAGAVRAHPCDYDDRMHLIIAALLMALTTTPKYEVFAIRYATLPQFPVASLVQGADRDRKIDIAMMVWLVRGGGRNILVDSGFYRDDLVKKVEAGGLHSPR